MAALGLDTDLVKVRSLGWRPVALAFALWTNLLFGGLLVARFLVVVRVVVRFQLGVPVVVLFQVVVPVVVLFQVVLQGRRSG